MSSTIRFGVVGAGAIAQRGILPHLSQTDIHDRVYLQAVCDPVPGRAAAAAAKFGVKRFFTSYEELLADGDVDAVTLASPISLHYEQGLQALAAGKHIHFNKTMTTTVAEATDLIDRALAQGLKLVASPGEVLRVQHRRVKELINDGAIGTLCWAVCGGTFGRYHEEEEFRQGDDVLSNVDPSWYFRKPGGGPLYDMTVYSLHSLTTILGPVRRVTALSGTRITMREFHGVQMPTDADDSTLMLLDFGGNLFALCYGVAAGRLSDTRNPTFFGSTGSIIGRNLNGTPFDYPGKDIADQEPGWTGEQWLLPHVVGPHRTIDEQHVFEDIMQLVDRIREDKPTPVSAEHARHVIDIIESAYRAAATGHIQAIKTTF